MEWMEENVQLGGQALRFVLARQFSAREEGQYWASLWPSAWVMAEALLEGASLEGMEVLELGCGSGLAGLAAGMRGATLTLSDVIPGAVELATGNLQRNGLEGEGLLLDWHEPPTDRQWDLLLAADVLYDERHFSALMNCFQQLLRPGGRVLLSEPGRPQAREFFADLLRAGFRVESQVREVEMYGECFRITLSEIR